MSSLFLWMTMVGLAAPAPSTLADAVDGSVPAFASSPATGEEVFMPHPFCTWTDGAWTSTWLERRTVWNCTYDDAGRIVQFVTTSMVTVTEFCNKYGQLERTEVVESFVPHLGEPEGVPPICDPGVTVTHTEVVKGARFFESKESGAPIDVLPGLLLW